MIDSDFSLVSFLIRILSILGSIVIGWVMLSQSQQNAIKRRSVLMAAARDGRAMGLLKHCAAFFGNILFVWLLQVSVMVLVASLVGFKAGQIFENIPFLVCCGILGLPIVALTVLGGGLNIASLRSIRR